MIVPQFIGDHPLFSTTQIAVGVRKNRRLNVLRDSPPPKPLPEKLRAQKTGRFSQDGFS